MWVRKLIRVGDSLALVIPTAVLAARGWKVGTFFMERVDANGDLTISAFDPATVPKRVVEQLEPLPEIKYG